MDCQVKTSALQLLIKFRKFQKKIKNSLSLFVTMSLSLCVSLSFSLFTFSKTLLNQRLSWYDVCCLEFGKIFIFYILNRKKFCSLTFFNQKKLSEFLKEEKHNYREIKQQRRPFASADFYCEILSDRYVHKNGVLQQSRNKGASAKRHVETLNECACGLCVEW